MTGPRFVSSDQAKTTSKQHSKPCSDCPWSRKSISGWLGPHDADTWLRIAHGDGRIECHALKGRQGNWQCAGAAIYRANVCKSVPYPEVMRLPSNTKLVFGFHEFKPHHEGDANGRT